YGQKAPYTESLPSTNQQKPRAQDVDLPPRKDADAIKNPFVIPGIRNIKIDAQLNPYYNFARFLEDESNRLARSGGLGVANQRGGTSFTSLLFFGGVGLGKTHVAQAIGLEVKEKYTETTVLYIPSDTFTQQYIDAVRRTARTDFIHFYQVIDVLIVD